MTGIAPTLAHDDAVMGDSALPDGVAGLVAPTSALAGGASPDLLHWGARSLAAAVPAGSFRLLADQVHDVEAGPLAQAVRAVMAEAHDPVAPR
jgi:hypothetical protein